MCMRPQVEGVIAHGLHWNRRKGVVSRAHLLFDDTGPSYTENIGEECVKIVS